MATKKKPQLTTLALNFQRTFDEARTAKGLTILDVATEAKMSKVTIYRAINGPDQMKVQTLERLAAVLDVSPTFFWGEV